MLFQHDNCLPFCSVQQSGCNCRAGKWLFQSAFVCPRKMGQGKWSHQKEGLLGSFGQDELHRQRERRKERIFLFSRPELQLHFPAIKMLLRTKETEKSRTSPETGRNWGCSERQIEFDQPHPRYMTAKLQQTQRSSRMSYRGEIKTIFHEHRTV